VSQVKKSFVILKENFHIFSLDISQHYPYIGSLGSKSDQMIKSCNTLKEKFHNFIEDVFLHHSCINLKLKERPKW